MANKFVRDFPSAYTTASEYCKVREKNYEHKCVEYLTKIKIGIENAVKAQETSTNVEFIIDKKDGAFMNYLMLILKKSGYNADYDCATKHAPVHEQLCYIITISWDKSVDEVMKMGTAPS